MQGKQQGFLCAESDIETNQGTFLFVPLLFPKKHLITVPEQVKPEEGDQMRGRRKNDTLAMVGATVPAWVED